MSSSAFLGCRSGAAGVAVLLLLFAACGPSVQSIYEGNVRFEHCYRLDMDPTIAPTHRQACWEEWKNLYTYGQSRDRIDYADRRIRALSSGDTSRPGLDLDAGPGEGGQVAPAEAPAPTAMHASPPPMAPPPPEAGPLADAGAEAGPPPPEAECAGKCKTTWLECGKPCRSDAGSDAGDAKQAKSCKACDPDYKKCMRRCFK